MLLKKILKVGKGCRCRRAQQSRAFQAISGSRESEIGSDGSFGSGVVVAVRATGVASPGTGAKRLVDNALDRTRATTAFGAATKAAIELLGAPRKVFGGRHGIAHVVITQHVAGTDNH
jgi:hypothetical protein